MINMLVVVVWAILVPAAIGYLAYALWLLRKG
jgi:hypothetical protein